VVLREDRPTHFVFPFPLLNAAGLPVIFRLPRNLATLVDLRHVATDGIYPFAHLFNGALVSLAAVRQIGNVNRDYFIYGDEVDYFFRLRKAGTVISVLNAMHYHPDVSNRPFSPAKVYYYVKNSLVLNARYYNAVWVRHALLLVTILGRMGKRNGIVFVFSLLMGRYALVFYTAVFRGLKGKIGKDFHG
jgi:GT2 family glycosyltransferase